MSAALTHSQNHGLILLSHGSRDPAWRRNAEQLLQLVRAAYPGAAVGNAYLDWCEPHLPEEIARLLHEHPALTTITIWPLLLRTNHLSRSCGPMRAAAAAWM